MISSQIPRNEPPEARAGLTWRWRREDLVATYPASSWTLKYWFKQLAAAGANFSVTAAADGDNFDINVAAATTQGYTAGKYSWSAVVTGGTSEAYEIDRGTLVVLARYDQAAALDDRGHARKMLDLVEAALEALTNLGVKSYTIGSRSYTGRDLPELTTLRDYYRGQVANLALEERIRNGQGGGRLVFKL